MTFAYTIIGGGPAGITAVIRILERLLVTDNAIKSSITAKNFVKVYKILKQKLCWIDPTFTVGAFGNEWRNVPGNTTRQKYRDTFMLMDKSLKTYGIQLPSTPFELENGDAEDPCQLAIPAQKLQWMSNQLMRMTTPLKIKAEVINLMDNGLKKITLRDKKEVYSQRVILAIGDQAKSIMPKAHRHKIILLENVADLAKLKIYVAANKLNPQKPILVHGSSHSAALAAMHLLLLGFTVHQVMNKPYTYYHTVEENGVIKTYHSNAGLNGNVAIFTKALFEQITQGEGQFLNQYKPAVVPDGIVKNYDDYDHIIEVVGRKANATLKINDTCSSLLDYNEMTTQTQVAGVFAIGSAYPRVRMDASGKLEKNNGASRYYGDIDCGITETWHLNPA